jgi:hypothetical protein
LVVGNLTVSTTLSYTPTSIPPISVTGCVDLSGGTLNVQGSCQTRSSVIASGSGCQNTPFASIMTPGYAASQEWVPAGGGQILSILSRCTDDTTVFIIAGSVGGGIGLVAVAGIGVAWYVYKYRRMYVHQDRDDVGVIMRGSKDAIRAKDLRVPLLGEGRQST